MIEFRADPADRWIIRMHWAENLAVRAIELIQCALISQLVREQDVVMDIRCTGGVSWDLKLGNQVGKEPPIDWGPFCGSMCAVSHR